MARQNLHLLIQKFQVNEAIYKCGEKHMDILRMLIPKVHNKPQNSRGLEINKLGETNTAALNTISIPAAVF